MKRKQAVKSERGGALSGDSQRAFLLAITKLSKHTVSELQDQYETLYGEGSRSRNKAYLVKRVAYRMQELHYGGLSDRAKARAKQLVSDAPIRRRLPKGLDPFVSTAPPKRDPRLPDPGTVITRSFRGEDHKVTVLTRGFEYSGKRFSSLSAVARTITGTKWNGFAFFQLGPTAP